jgi:hypothetical protein
MSLFGGFDFLGQVAVIQGNPSPASPPSTGGFPGMFPGAGVSNSGWAGFGQGTYGKVGVCTQADVQAGRCVMGPPMSLMGPAPARRH